jgi:hypothetical protein
MKDFKLKFILSALAGIVFSFIFILLAFALPIKDKKQMVITKPKGKLEQISHALKTK